LGASSILEKRINNMDGLTPSIQVLLSKALKITLLATAVIVTLSSLGINLSAFAFFGGAIGVGVGFGLQKVVSNLVSGVILLLDRSIKPGDVIEIGATYGRIESLGARYVSVATRDNTEYLIPNEDLITTQVVNWSFSDKLVRLKVVVGVSYDSDIHEVMRLMVAAAVGIPRVLAEPKPVCQLKNFGDSSIDMELRLWITDPENGVSNVRSAVRIAVWDMFKAHGIEIPFPQRDLHIKSGFRESPEV
jgi:small-conductance mechanosensitive channel